VDRDGRLNMLTFTTTLLGHAQGGPEHEGWRQKREAGRGFEPPTFEL
jgi:hypothetical protein